MPDASSRIRADETRAGTASDLIVAEFNYIAQTAFQANEDRARVSQLFFVTFGTVIAALYSSQLSPEEAEVALITMAYLDREPDRLDTLNLNVGHLGELAAEIEEEEAEEED